jgi:hypothetical protein
MVTPTVSGELILFSLRMDFRLAPNAARKAHCTPVTSGVQVPSQFHRVLERRSSRCHRCCTGHRAISNLQILLSAWCDCCAVETCSSLVKFNQIPAVSAPLKHEKPLHRNTRVAIFGSHTEQLLLSRLHVLNRHQALTHIAPHFVSSRPNLVPICRKRERHCKNFSQCILCTQHSRECSACSQNRKDRSSHN